MLTPNWNSLGLSANVGCMVTSATDTPLEYRAQYASFKEAVARASTISYGCGDIVSSHSRENYTATLFTKLTVTAMSLLKLCPDPSEQDFEYAHLDFTSCAALSRVIMDTFVALFHFGIEDCAEDEFQVRQLLLFWRDFRVRIKMRVIDDPEPFVSFHDSDLRSRLNANSFWLALPEKQRADLLNRNNMLHSHWETLKRAGFEEEVCRAIYAYWSAHTHCDSVAFINMPEQRRGAGYINEIDIELLATCLHFSEGFLRCASDWTNQMFADAEGRANLVSGHKPFSTVQPRRPWAGKSILELRDADVSRPKV